MTSSSVTYLFCLHHEGKKGNTGGENRIKFHPKEGSEEDEWQAGVLT